jgi:hypothetical protein
MMSVAPLAVMRTLHSVQDDKLKNNRKERRRVIADIHRTQQAKGDRIYFRPPFVMP